MSWNKDQEERPGQHPVSVFQFGWNESQQDKKGSTPVRSEDGE